MISDTVLQWAGAVTVIVAALTALLGVWRFVRRVMLSLEDFLADWRGEAARPGHRARPGVLERLRALELGMSDVRAQLLPTANGHGSLRDQVDEIKAAVTEDEAP